MMKIGLIFGGRSVEHKVSINSARTISHALRTAGHEVVPLALATDGCWVETALGQAALQGQIDAIPAAGGTIRSSVEQLLRADAEVIFPILHGTWGEDGSLQGLCEMLDLPYVGCGVTSSAVAMDKWLCKGLLRDLGLPVVDGELVTREDVEASKPAVLKRLERLGAPVFVKPCVGGSSVGVNKAKNPDDLCRAILEGLRFDDRVVVECGIDGREIECAVLGYRQLEASVLGEIVPGQEFYDYADKYLEDGAQLIAPAELPDEITTRLRQVAVQAFAAINGWGMARVDFLLEDGGSVYINEINTLPGFTEISMYPRLWNLSGVPLPELVDRLVKIALQRHRERQQLDAGIRDWIDQLSAG